MRLRDDLSIFVGGEFGRAALVFAGQAGERQIMGVYDEDYFAAAGLVDVSASQPALLCDPADVADVEQGTPLDMEGAGAYSVADIRPDGTGLTLLLLHRR